jgi:Ca2+-transporting ATPase
MTRRAWTTLTLGLKTFWRIDGAQGAAAFAHYAFFSLFPLLTLIVTVASGLIDRDRAGRAVVAFLERYVPIRGAAQSHVFDAISGVVDSRGRVGVVALIILAWVAVQCFSSLVCATNRAWGAEPLDWWRFPLKSLVLLGITSGAVFLGMAAPVLERLANAWLFTAGDSHFWIHALGSFVLPLLVVFLGLSLFYRLAPRRSTRFAEVWPAALCATLLLRAAEYLFSIYLKDFTGLNVIYGAFGGIMAFLLWIHLSGCIFIFGACLCAARAGGSSTPGED